MVQSMTGFGSAEKNGYRVEIRSLNSRFLDIHIKAPSILSQFDIPFRNQVKERFARGKFDVSISLSENISADFKVNSEIAGKLYAAFKDMQETLSIPGEIDIGTIAGFHQMYLDTGVSYDPDILHEVFGIAIEALADMRVKEGASLSGELRKMADSLEEMNDRIKELKSNTLIETRDKFNEKINALLEGRDFDSNRILQEASLMAIKLDIAEEISRIESHLKQFREMLSGNDIIGRRLDFIVQELNREINTVTSKSSDYVITSLTVEMKTVIEKIKEQVQNIQ
jgi:uncharacterized protein (TIGR00255 family)